MWLVELSVGCRQEQKHEVSWKSDLWDRTGKAHINGDVEEGAGSFERDEVVGGKPVLELDRGEEGLQRVGPDDGVFVEGLLRGCC